MSKKINVGVIGASGYSGEELLKIIQGHPDAEIGFITSRQYSGRNIGDIFPRLWKQNLKFAEPEVSKILKSDADVFFLALPHKVASEFAVPLLEEGFRVIDISADFRLKKKEVYREYYGNVHPAPELLEKSVYGLPELNREKISDASLVACPGCYPTSILIPLYPLIKESLIELKDITVCSGSGVTGAGRKVDIQFIYPECSESFRAYSPSGHRHIPEIEQQINEFAGSWIDPVKINFIPHLVPMNRGMNSTLVLKASKSFSEDRVTEAYEKYYDKEEFVRVLPSGRAADTKNTVLTNVCEIGYVYDSRTDKLIVTSSIDNLTKGSAGQAVQCMNIMFNMNENSGL